MKLNIVPARTGLLWVKLGIRTFFRQPLAMAGLFFMFMSSVVLLSLVPGAGLLLGSMLVPAFTLGLMAAAQEAEKGRFPMPSVLASAFRAGRERARAMLVLGLIYAGGSVLVQGIVQLVGDPRPVAVPAAGTAGAPPMDPMLLLALALHTPLFLMFWHAPALVHWHGIPPAKSLFFSLVACLRNIGAFLVFGLIWMAVFTGVGLVFSLVLGAIAGPQAVGAAMMPLALIMAAMFSTSLWFTFRDCFLAEAPAASPPSDPPRSSGDPS
jgi:hypothetical protein